MTMFTLPEGVSVDDFDEYESGCIDQRDRCEREARILTFGAIRRAAKHARNCDLEMHQTSGFVWRGDTPQSAAIRCAIRLAIGSDKA